MARRLHQQRFVADCELTLIEVGNPKAGPGYLPDPLPDPRPLVQVGAGGLVIETRCPDDGESELEVWVGDPGQPPRGWEVVFDGQLETAGRGFDAGDATASVFHVNAPPGTYRVRAEARRDRGGLIDAVRFIFPESPDLDGNALR